MTVYDLIVALGMTCKDSDEASNATVKIISRLGIVSEPYVVEKASNMSESDRFDYSLDIDDVVVWSS